ncbi:molybdopterin-synthase adenylyltransferase MoeB [Siphonobacter curvatus]|uniref:Molybdopterin-synthase adenylyltransferase n=1 Tax=Siphonobacter curvatus TaxID=2094562 RepID=A0A2S7ISS3_9BACT|nr:molybdopterin-synthase adenylyltransferase MoeB [Siphonobacter curvatus]PQA60754.1 thiamine biosynthesis protein ThiF [Siphonobacter curvatus]
MLSSAEKQRYQKHLLLPEVGAEGQERLKNARVLVVGAGGLGCPVLLYLAAAGVGTLGIVDGDTVDETNLQRQVLYDAADVDRPKATTAAAQLRRLNDLIDYEVFTTHLVAENAASIIERFDLVVDCTDNFSVRYLINDVCVLSAKPFVYGAIHRFEGQVSVFNYPSNGILGPTYRCLFPSPPSGLEIPNCSEVGVLGILPGMIGMYQANEVIKIITGVGKVLSGELMLMDLLENTQRKMKFKRRTDAEMLAQQGMETHRKLAANVLLPNEISAIELMRQLKREPDTFLLDVRNSDEYEVCHLPGAVLIPMPTIPTSVKHIPRDRPVIVYCHHGMRSASVIQYLEQEHGYDNLTNLDGGIHAWADEVDLRMAKY